VKFVTDGQEIRQKIALARDLMDARGMELAGDQVLQRLLEGYDAAINDTFACMRELDLGGLCGMCATSVEGGGCCGRGIDEWYDHYLMLMNMMLGIGLPESRHDPSGCFFLGPSGCTIRARYHFCVNYLCYRIHEKYTDEELQRLGAASGRELYMSWRLEMRLRELGF
jgi:hypothetical protein